MVHHPRFHRNDRADSSPSPRRSLDSVAESRTEDARASSANTANGVKRFLMILAILGSIQVIVMLGVEAHRAVEGRRAIARLNIDIAALEVEAAGLAAVVEHADDPVYREQLARRRGFVYPDEVRVVPVR